MDRALDELLHDHSRELEARRGWADRESDGMAVPHSGAKAGFQPCAASDTELAEPAPDLAGRPSLPAQRGPAAMSLLSVVAASRNDGHGLHRLPRMQVFIDGLADQVARFGRDVELVLVDWNPPRDHPPLSEVLTAPATRGFVVRVITVPPEVHAGLSISSNLSFFQMIAKNVGIRRAEGEAVLATNIDIRLSDGLFLDSTGDVPDRRVYRTDRVDIAFDPGMTVDAGVLRGSPAIRVHKKTGMYYPGVGMRHQQVRGGASLARVALKNPVDFMRRATRRIDLARYRQAFISIFGLPQLHLNACGDFTLMTRKSWEELRGYPEWEVFSFHLEHSAGWSLESQTTLFDRLKDAGIPVLSDVDALEVAHAIWSGRKHGRWRTNLAGWGMSGRNLPETSLRAVSHSAH